MKERWKVGLYGKLKNIIKQGLLSTEQKYLIPHK